VPGERATGRADTTSLRDEHTTAAVRRRLAEKRSPSYLKDFIYGAIDGTITTFAVVAGVDGANLDEAIVVILGGANLIADGFSMAASNFLGTRAERQQRERARHEEERHVDLLPEGEREEIRQIFAAKGFEGDELERVIDVITANRELWVETMMTEELGLSPTPRSPLRAAFATFFAFVTVGFLPLLVFVYELATPGEVGHKFAWSAVMTAAAFAVVGAVKSRFVDQPWWRSALETLAVGGTAAALAYAAGALLQQLV
jgi:vacuolar iron transporter family protein